MRAAIGPKWLILLILTFGVLEIPWVGYLFFFQAPEGVAQHTHVAAAGLIGGSAVLAALAAGWLWRGARSAAILTVMTGTWMGVVLLFALTISSVPVVLATIPGLLVAAMATRDVLQHPDVTVSRWLPALLLGIALVLIVRLGVSLAWTGTSIAADHLRFLIVVYDCLEVVALIGLGLGMRAGRHRTAIVIGSMGMVLFLLDAFVNVVVVSEGPAFIAAVFFAVVGEFPSIAMSAAGVGLAMRRWTEVTAMPSRDAKMGA